jgi:hypothetical protein
MLGGHTDLSGSGRLCGTLCLKSQSRARSPVADKHRRHSSGPIPLLLVMHSEDDQTVSYAP